MAGLPSPCPRSPSSLPTRPGRGVPGFGAEVGGWGQVQGSAQQEACFQPGTFLHSIHAEFQLSEPPDFPFWFSPAQFTGHIILSKDATHVRDFRLFVPNHR